MVVLTSKLYLSVVRLALMLSNSCGVEFIRVSSHSQSGTEECSTWIKLLLCSLTVLEC